MEARCRLDPHHHQLRCLMLQGYQISPDLVGRLEREHFSHPERQGRVGNLKITALPKAWRS